MYGSASSPSGPAVLDTYHPLHAPAEGTACMLRPSRTRTEGSRSSRAATTALGMLSFVGMAAGLGAVAADEGGVSGPGTAAAVHDTVDASTGELGRVGDAVRAGEIGDPARAGEVGDAARAAASTGPGTVPGSSPAAPLARDAGTTPAVEVPAPAAEVPASSAAEGPAPAPAASSAAGAATAPSPSAPAPKAVSTPAGSPAAASPAASSPAASSSAATDAPVQPTAAAAAAVPQAVPPTTPVTPTTPAGTTAPVTAPVTEAADEDPDGADPDDEPRKRSGKDRD